MRTPGPTNYHSLRMTGPDDGTGAMVGVPSSLKSLLDIETVKTLLLKVPQWSSLASSIDWPNAAFFTWGEVHQLLKDKNEFPGNSDAQLNSRIRNFAKLGNSLNADAERRSTQMVMVRVPVLEGGETLPFSLCFERNADASWVLRNADLFLPA